MQRRLGSSSPNFKVKILKTNTQPIQRTYRKRSQSKKVTRFLNNSKPCLKKVQQRTIAPSSSSNQFKKDYTILRNKGAKIQSQLKLKTRPAHSNSIIKSRQSYIKSEDESDTVNNKKNKTHILKRGKYSGDFLLKDVALYTLIGEPGTVGYSSIDEMDWGRGRGSNL